MKISSIKFTKSVVDLVPESSPVKTVIELPQVFFLGRSNVGKSSLINSLFGKKDMARVSAQAGKTRTINIFEVNEKYECLDFPGYGYARGGHDAMERLRDMIINYLEKTAGKKTRIVQVIDAYVGPTALDREVFDYLWSRNTDLLFILNKTDKTTQKQQEELKRQIEKDFSGTPYVFYSCTSAGRYHDDALRTIFTGL